MAGLEVPIVGIGQASILAAAIEGRQFGIATSTPLLANSLSGLVRYHGKGETFTGVRLTPSDPLVLAANPEQQYEELGEAVRACVEEDGAQAVVSEGRVLGCIWWRSTRRGWTCATVAAHSMWPVETPHLTLYRRV